MCNQISEAKNETNTISIVEAIQCGCGFSTKDGKEMYQHLWGNPHVMFWSEMQYVMSWAVGDNTYDWMIRGLDKLDASRLRKCQTCKMPYIAYDRKDNCKKCQKGVVQ